MDLRLHRLLPFIPPHLARKIIADPYWEEHADWDRVPGAILFADILGFTPLTESLEKTGKEAPEELTRLLNEFFSRLIDELESESGEVVKFSGDALMVLFPAGKEGPAISVRRAEQAAQRMQRLAEGGSGSPSLLGDIVLRIKVGIGVGELVAMEIGGLLGRWEYVMAGDPIAQATRAEEQAAPGEIILSEEAQAIIHPEPLEPQTVGSVAFQRLENFEQVEKTLRRFVPGAVLGWLETQDRGWLCVLRPMTVLFMGSTDLAFQTQDDLQSFHKLVRNIQRTLYRFEGSLNKVAVDDKGTTIMALFGAPPLAHTDDAVRAVKAALEVSALARKIDQPLAIGITTGLVFAGPVGSERRYEYTVMGDSVNVAARLMKTAGHGRILCDERTFRQARERIRIRILEPISIKGKAEPVAIYQPDDDKLTSRLISGSFRPPRSMFGRDLEVAQIKERLGELREGRGSVVVVHGGTGIGKSRLLKEIEIQAKIQGVPTVRGTGRSTERDAALRAWQSVFEGFFGIEGEPDGTQRFIGVQALIGELAPGHTDQIVLLRDILGLEVPQGTQEIILDPDTREQSLLNLITTVLGAWLGTRPLVITMDDVQWMDDPSWDLLAHLAQRFCSSGHPLLIAVATRPMERAGHGQQVLTQMTAKVPSARIEPKALSREETSAMLANRLRLAAERIPESLISTVFSRSEGNPFIAEELIRAMVDQNLIEVWKDDDSQLNKVRVRGRLSERSESLPGSVRGLLLARMDRLTAEQQLTLKVAAIFGRTFSLAGLQAIMTRQSDISAERVAEFVVTFTDMEFVEVESADPELVYRFCHQVTQEVAYDSMLFSQRRKLHLAVGDWQVENHYPQFNVEVDSLAELQVDPRSLGPLIADLASHYRIAGDRRKDVLFSVLAALRAQQLFQNEEAESHLNHALERLEDDPAGRFMLLKHREAVYTRVAHRARRKADLQALQEVAAELGDNGCKAEVAVLQSHYQLNHGRLAAACELARAGIKLSQAARSLGHEARARRALAMALLASGQPGEAWDEMEAALKLAENVADRELEGEVTIELARFAEQSGRFDRCLQYCDRALSYARDHGRIGQEARILRRMASARMALGEYQAASSCAEQAEEIQRQIGDRRQECVTLDLQGRIAVALGDYARGKEFFERSLGQRQEIQDRIGQLNSLTLLGASCFHLGQYEKARLCYQQALEDARDMGMVYNEAEILARVVLLEHSAGNNEKAMQHGLEASRSLARLSNPSLLAAVLTNLGHAQAELGAYDAAAATYGNAVDLRRRLRQNNLLAETLAGLALLEFRRGQHRVALGHVEDVLQLIDRYGLDGTDQPFRIYQTCFEVLEHFSDPRGPNVIKQAHASLQQSADAISDELLRDSFMQSVIENRAISYYYQGIARRGQG